MITPGFKKALTANGFLVETPLYSFGSDKRFPTSGLAQSKADELNGRSRPGDGVNVVLFIGSLTTGYWTVRKVRG